MKTVTEFKMTEFGKRLAIMRRMKLESLEEQATALGITVQCIAEYEWGRRKPNEYLIDKVADHYLIHRCFIGDQDFDFSLSPEIRASINGGIMSRIWDYILIPLFVFCVGLNIWSSLQTVSVLDACLTGVYTFWIYWMIRSTIMSRRKRRGVWVDLAQNEYVMSERLRNHASREQREQLL